MSKKCCCAVEPVEDEIMDVVIEDDLSDGEACDGKSKKCCKKCCCCCKFCKALVFIGLGFLIGVHFRAIKACIKGQPLPKAPKWHCWVK